MPRLFIDPDWVTGETCLFLVTDVVDHAIARRKVGNMRREFINKLQEEGFEITYDKDNLKDDDICFTMNDHSIVTNDVNDSDFKKTFDKIIIDAGKDALYYPKSVSMEEYFENPFFPCVFKNEGTNGGKDKFLIENMDQVNKIKKFYDKYKNDSKIKGVFNFCIFQQYIETPTNYKTYIRVLSGINGDVLGASLKYSKGFAGSKEIEGELEEYFLDPKSEYFLDCKSMFGYYSAGGNISFSQPKYSTEKKSILEAHNIDPENVEVPLLIREACKNIMESCNKQLGIMVGFDFILNELDNKWYYLECQAFPAIDEWAEANGIKAPKRGDLNNYYKHLELDIEARYDALKRYVDGENRGYAKKM